MAATFDFDEKKSAQENISDFLKHIESVEPVLGPLVRKHIGKMLPLPEAVNARSVARALFNAEIKTLLDQALVSSKIQHD